MIDWWMLLTPLVVLPIFLLFRFIGCDSVWSVDYVKSYDERVLGESSLVAYWKLGDKTSDVLAKDEKGAHAGHYGQAAPTASQNGSQGATGEVKREQPGVHNPTPTHTAVDFQGGYVAVPFATDFAAESFTIEAWVMSGGPAEWLPGFSHVVVASGENDGTTQRGFSLYAGYDANQQKLFWSAALATGTAVVALTGPEVQTQTPPVATYLVFRHRAGSANQPGEAILSVSVAGASTIVTPPLPVSGYTPPASANLYIGASSATPQPLPMPPPNIAPPVEFPYIGRIQDVAFYRTALGDSTLAEHRGS